jgi:ABC-2 type transport system ATP-binding protein
MERALAMVEVEHVYRRFNMAKEKVDSIKELMLRKVRGNLHFEEFFALQDVSLRVNRGDVYGLIGLNGSGKSTLLKIIAGVMKPSAGKCVVRGTVAPLIELGAGFDIDLTGRENIYLNGTVLGMEPGYIDEKFADIVEFSELRDFLDVAVKNYSSGMVARLAFSVATIMKPDILLCDEILSVGDFLFQQKCERRMRELMSGGTTVLLVSHSIELIERMCNRASWLSRGRVVAEGSCAAVCGEYKAGARAGGPDA